MLTVGGTAVILEFATGGRLMPAVLLLIEGLKLGYDETLTEFTVGV